MAELQKKGKEQAIMPHLLLINPHNLSCVHPIISSSYNIWVLSISRGTHQFTLSSLFAEKWGKFIILVYCFNESNEARFRTGHCPEQWAGTESWAGDGQRDKHWHPGLIASCKVPHPLPCSAPARVTESQFTINWSSNRSQLSVEYL